MGKYGAIVFSSQESTLSVNGKTGPNGMKLTHAKIDIFSFGYLSFFTFPFEIDCQAIQGWIKFTP